MIQHHSRLLTIAVIELLLHIAAAILARRRAAAPHGWPSKEKADAETGEGRQKNDPSGKKHSHATGFSSGRTRRGPYMPKSS
jgi:hypothetical protein